MSSPMPRPGESWVVQPMREAHAAPSLGREVHREGEERAMTEAATMRTEPEAQERAERPAGDDPRRRLLAGLPVLERRLELAGVSTAVLEGGEGAPVVLLHEQGEFAARWMSVIPGLVPTHRVVAPDLPGHGSSEVIG